MMSCWGSPSTKSDGVKIALSSLRNFAVTPYANVAKREEDKWKDRRLVR